MTRINIINIKNIRLDLILATAFNILNITNINRALLGRADQDLQY